MPKTNKFPQVVRARVSIDTHEKLIAAAEVAGLSIGRYIRYKLDNIQTPDTSKLKLVNELKRQGGLMKHLAGQGHPTGQLADEIKRTLRIIQTN